MEKSYSNLESLTLKCAQKSLNYFKTASVDRVGYLRHLDLDTFKTVVIRFDGKIVLFNIPKNNLTVINHKVVLKENPEKWLHKDTDWIFTGWNLNDIEGFDKREWMDSGIDYHNYIFEIN